MFDASIPGKLKQFTIGERLIQVAVVDHEFILERRALSDDFSRGRDDGRQSDLADSFLDSRFADGGDPTTVLIGAGLHAQLMMEAGKAVEVNMEMKRK